MDAWHSRAQNRLGQMVPLFGLMFTVVCATVGLAIDSGVSYLVSAEAQRAASAGALAGVVYMPEDFTSASAAALKAAGDNGFVDGAVVNGHTVSVTPSLSPVGCAGAACATNRLTVTVTESVPTSFMRILGFGAHDVLTTQTAEYLRPVAMGQPGPQLGADDVSFGNGAAANFFVMEAEGWAVGREQGDAFTPNPSTDFPSDPMRPDIHQLNGATGTDTVGQPLQRGGYNYMVFVPAGQSIQVRVFNPAFAPSNTYMPAGATVPIDEGHFLGQTAVPPDYTHDRTEYTQMAYSLFKVGSVFSRQQDQALTRMVVKPIDAYNAPAGYFDLYGGGAVAGMPALFHQWVNVGAADSSPSDASLTSFSGSAGPPPGILSGGASGAYYRLRVDSLDSEGNDPDPATGPTAAAQNMKSAKFYSVQAWDPVAGTTCAGCTVSAMDDMAFQVRLLPGASASANTIPIMSIPQEYAGRNLSLTLFDPGDLGPSVAPPPPTRVPTEMSAWVANNPGTVFTQGEIVLLAAQVQWQPPPETSMQTYDCDSEPSGDSGPPGTPTIAPITFYDGNPAAGGTILSDYLAASSSFDPCGGQTWNPGMPYIQVTSLSPGVHTIYVEYPGNSVVAPSEATTTVTIANPAPAAPMACTIKPWNPPRLWTWDDSSHTSVDIEFYIQEADGSTAQPPGMVQITNQKGKVLWSSSVGTPWSGDTGFTNSDIKAGSTLTATYLGSGKFLPCSYTDPTKFPTVKPPPPPPPQNVATTTTVAPSANPLASGSLVILTSTTNETATGNPVSGGGVNFCLDDSSCSSASIICSGSGVASDGTAFCATSSMMTTGTHTIYASYGGSGSWKPSIGSTTITVTTSTGGGTGGGGGTAYEGGAAFGAVPNYSRPHTPHAVLLSAAVSSAVEIKVLQPDGTVASAVSVDDLGPSEYGTMPCPDFPTGCPSASAYQDGAGNAAIFTNDSALGNVFNGKWLRITIRVPANYNPGANSFWSLQYITQANCSPQDTITLTAGFQGAPVHILA